MKSLGTMLRTYRFLCLGLFIYALAYTPTLKALDEAGKRTVPVGTFNFFVGDDFASIITETNLEMIPIRVAETLGVMAANDFTARAEALADEIVSAMPSLIGLQEVSLIRRQIPGDYLLGNPEPATLVEMDYLEIILDALYRRGASYEAVVTLDELDVELPVVVLEGSGFRLDDIRLTDRDVILARTDLPPGFLRLSNPMAANFDAALILPLAGGLEVVRGWCSVDVKVRGRAFRFITTHLENAYAPVRVAQAIELMEGPINTSLPIIAVGDFNTDANGTGDDGYNILIDGGLRDAWVEGAPLDPGNTCCQANLLVNETSLLSVRYDLILIRGDGFSVEEVDLAGESTEDRVPSEVLGGMLIWPSDHAGVTSTLRLK